MLNVSHWQESRLDGMSFKLSCIRSARKKCERDESKLSLGDVQSTYPSEGADTVH